MQNLLTSDLALTLLATLFGAAWTLFKSTEFFEQRQRARTRQALGILETAVEETYRTYVESIKESRADGALTPEERRRAREMAKARALHIARRNGQDLLRDVGAEHLDKWIAKLVKRLKRS